MEIKAILFDFGGTLLEYHREEVMRALLDSQGIKVTSEKVLQAYATVEPTWNRLFSELTDDRRLTDERLRLLDRMVIEHAGVEDGLDELSTYVQANWDRVDRYLPRSLTRRAYPDALPCLEALSRTGLKRGVVSNIQSERRLRTELDQVGMLKFFPLLLASGTVGIDKPSRGIFDMAAAKLGLRPREIMFVGDDLERDYFGAQSAGMNPVLIDRYGRYTGEPLTRIASLGELTGLLKNSQN